MDDTYITLTSRESIHIVNKSEVPIEFEWRAFQNENEERERKEKLLR